MPVLMIIGFGFPLFILLKLAHLKKLKQFRKSNILYKYGFFYISYKKKYYFYDSVVFFRKIIILILASIFSNELWNNKK